VISNNAETIRIVNNPKALIKILNDEGIQFPPTIFDRNDLINSTKYLVKKIGGNGGEHIQYEYSYLNKATLSNDNFYYQECIIGKVYSVVFLANGKKANLIGFNRLLAAKQFIDLPFLYEGAISTNIKNQEVLDDINNIVNKITKRIELFGLCGIDFIIDESGSMFVIDINPRPPSTFELHESKQSLFLAHINCFNNASINYSADKYNFSKGHMIYYASKDLLLPENLIWPTWVKDKPFGRQEILKKNPICTIYAEGSSEEQVENTLKYRFKEIELFIKSI